MTPVRFGVVVFPGSNCDADSYHAVSTFAGAEPRYLWHKDTHLDGLDCVILPGGFSYGDYLRCGAIARFSPIMKAVRRFAEDGGLVIGICNGFQILLEAGMLPGAMLQNRGLKFICKLVNLRVESNRTPFTGAYETGQVIRLPVAHHEGNYYIGEAGMRELEENNQIIVRYCDEDGAITPKANPNGSLANIAGICNRERNVFGVMPHPERVCDEIIGGADGRGVFESIIGAVAGAGEQADPSSLRSSG
ncbi:MAG: phosphoribosylformylglycinamidine synthase subunit PurQ [Thermoleophilia bacterium]|nr:phosphoribosylformylglycinamidine synthase subunit PurQ [Thermoleophilia bacterium]